MTIRYFLHYGNSSAKFSFRYHVIEKISYFEHVRQEMTTWTPFLSRESIYVRLVTREFESQIYKIRVMFIIKLLVKTIDTMSCNMDGTRLLSVYEGPSHLMESLLLSRVDLCQPQQTVVKTQSFQATLHVKSPMLLHLPNVVEYDEMPIQGFPFPENLNQ